MSEAQGKLRRGLHLFEMVSLVAGAVIGGWLAEAPYWFELTGAGCAILFPIIAALLVPVGLAIAELTAMMPYASGFLAFTQRAFGRGAAFWTQWMFFLVQVIEPPLMVFIWAAIISYFFGIVDFTLVKEITVILLLVWFAISMYKIEFVGKLADAVFIIMVLAALIVGTAFYASGHWTLANITEHGGFFPNGVYGASLGMAVLVLKFIGFEFAPVFAEEVKFPRKEFWKPILIALFFPAALYTFASFAFAGMAPWQTIANFDLPGPRIIEMYGLPKALIFVSITAGFLHAFSTMAGFWLSSARALYGFAQLGYLPKKFMETNKYGQPWLANIAVLALSLIFVVLTPPAWVQYIYAISCVAAGILYVVVMLDWWVLRKKEPDAPREYKAPGGAFSFIIGLLMSVWIIIGSLLTMPTEGFYAFGGFVLLGVIVWLVGNKYQKEGKWVPEIEL